MKQFTKKEFIKILKYNGYELNRIRGSHFIYKNKNGKHISIPKKIESVIVLRLIKENNLKLI